MELSQKIIEYRAKYELSQSEFSKLCGVSRYTLWKAEKGKPIRKTSEAKIKMTMEGKR